MGLDIKEIHERIDDALPKDINISKFEIAREAGFISVKIELGLPKEKIFVKATSPKKEPTCCCYEVDNGEPKQKVAERDKFIDMGLFTLKDIQEIFRGQDGYLTRDYVRTSSLFTPDEKENFEKTACDIGKKETKSVPIPSHVYKKNPALKPTLKDLHGHGVFSRKGSDFDDERPRFVKSSTEVEETWVKAKEKYEDKHNRKCDINHHTRANHVVSLRGAVSETEVMADLKFSKQEDKKQAPEAKPSISTDKLSVEDDFITYLEITKSFLNRNIDKAILWIKNKNFEIEKLKNKEQDISNIKKIFDKPFNKVL